MPRNLPPRPPPPAPADPPERAPVEAAVAASAAAQPETWAALARCARLQVYTAGVAPSVRGAMAGCAALVEGQGQAGDAPAASPLSLATALPGTAPGSEGRAALAGLLLGQAVLLRLAAGGWSGSAGPLWTTDQAAVAGQAGGPPQADLGAALAHQQHLLRWAVPGGLRFAWWPPGEGAGATVTDLALAAAFAGDAAALARYRALRPARAATPTAPPLRPPLDSDYTLVLGHRPAVGQLVGTPVYRLWRRDGRSRRGSGPPVATGGGPDGDAWAGLLAALTDLLDRIARRRRDPVRYSLTVYSSQEPLVAALRDLGPGPPATVRQAQALLRRFGAVRVFWHPAALLAAWMEADEGPVTSDQ